MAAPASKDGANLLKSDHFYAEIVKFGIILTHLNYFGEGKKISFGEMLPMVPPLIIATLF